MHYTGTIWRPPYEAGSALVQATAGCTHHRCKFCTLYHDLPFRLSPLEEVEARAGLIAQAWGLPQEIHQASVDLIQKEKELVRSGSHEAALPDSELLETYDGPMIVELLWGLFETAVKLEDAQDRAAIHELAIMTADNLSLDEWIEACGPAKGQN